MFCIQKSASLGVHAVLSEESSGAQIRPAAKESIIHKAFLQEAGRELELLCHNSDTGRCPALNSSESEVWLKIAGDNILG